MKVFRWVVLAGSVLGVVPVHADAPDLLERGREYTKQFYAGEIVVLHQSFSDEMKQTMSLEALGAFREKVTGQAGIESRLLDESLVPRGPVTMYSRLAVFDKAPMPLIMQWTMGPDGLVRGFFIRPASAEAPSEHADYQTKTSLRLPFDGEWYVFWGGRTILQNYHAATVDQRFAYDLVIMQEGRSYRGTGELNEDYYAFGQPIRSPGPGVVVAVVDSVAENTPGKLNPIAPAGNYIIIDHGDGEYSLLAHFKRGTIVVKPGDHLAAGTLLGACGNSGNSSEPHLHYHLQDGPEFGKAEGLPVQFLNYVADGKDVERGEPRRGETIHAK